MSEPSSSPRKKVRAEEKSSASPEPSSRNEGNISRGAKYSISFESLFNIIPDPGILLDGEGRVRALNQAAAAWLRKEPRQLIGQSIDVVLPSPLSADVFQAMKGGGAKKWEREMEGRILSCFLKSLTGGHYPAPASALFLADITEARNKEMRLGRQVKLQDFLIRLASSLLTTPIDKIDEVMQLALGPIGTYSDADRAYLLIERGRGQIASMLGEWRSPGTPYIKDNLQLIDPRSFSWW